MVFEHEIMISEGSCDTAPLVSIKLLQLEECCLRNGSLLNNNAKNVKNTRSFKRKGD